MEYKDPGRYTPIIYLHILGVPGLGFPVESLYIMSHEDGTCPSSKWLSALGAIKLCKGPSSLANCQVQINNSSVRTNDGGPGS